MPASNPSPVSRPPAAGLRRVAVGASARIYERTDALPEGVVTMRHPRPCKYCKHMVAPTAKRCSMCGGKRPYPVTMLEAVVGLALLVGVVVLLYALFG